MFSISKESALAAASTCLFVLLWSSGAIFSKWGLAHASPFAFLLMRFAIAFMALLLIIPLMKFQMPRGSSAVGYALATGVVLLGAYQIFYLLALDLKVTPGVIATVMGVQPILTAVIMERRHSFSRSLGLLLGLVGLVLVVYQGIGLAGLSWAGMLYALLALASMTAGTLMQKRITHNPLGTLPLQYLAGLLVCAVFVPFQPFHFEHSAGFVVPVLWMGLVVSVLATLLLYRMIARGNLVNVHDWACT
jgi:drug/metabolite transporter (DMT)-like permease